MPFFFMAPEIYCSAMTFDYLSSSPNNQDVPFRLLCYDVTILEWYRGICCLGGNSGATTLADPVALRGLLLGYTEPVLALQVENEGLRSKAAYHDAVAKSGNCQI